MHQLFGPALPLGERAAGAFDVRPGPGVAAVEEQDAPPDVDGFLVPAGEVVIETREQQLVDLRVPIGIAALAPRPGVVDGSAGRWDRSLIARTQRDYTSAAQCGRVVVAIALARAGAMPSARIFRYRLLRSTPSTSAVREMLPCCGAERAQDVVALEPRRAPRAAAESPLGSAAGRAARTAPPRNARSVAVDRRRRAP